MADYPDRESVFSKAIADHQDAIQSVLDQQDILEKVAQAMTACLHSGGQIFWCGNGGSAGDSQHLAAEIVGRFRRERRGLASIALTTDTSILTSIANDYGYELVFSRQVQALGRPGDVLVGISTSGNSPNVICAIEQAKSQDLTTVAFTGQGGGRMANLADFHFAVDAPDTARVQEMHMLAGHMLSDWVEAEWVASEAEAVKGVMA